MSLSISTSIPGVGVPTSEEQSELVAESPNSHLKEVITSGLNKIIQQEQVS